MATLYERAAGAVDAMLTFEVEAEAWRHLDVSVGAPPTSKSCDNSIKTSKYNVVTFVPKSLFEQFRRTANQYFLGISILMMIGTYSSYFYSPLSPWSTIMPLAVILGVTMAKEGVEDAKRHKSDKLVNNAPAVVLGAAGAETTTRWKDLRPGHVVVVNDREEIPADLVLLWASDAQAYVETSNIDGETNLKIKRPAADARGDAVLGGGPEGAAGEAFAVEFEPPCGRVHTFEGTLRRAGAEIPLDAAQFLLRGSTLRNTKRALGVVVYTGRDTRLVRNARETPSKLSELERVVNNMVLFILGAMVTITTASMTAYVLWFASHKKDLWYMCYRYHAGGVPPLFRDNCRSDDNYAPGSTWPTFFILFNNFVPISLYVTIEMINFVQARYIDNDLEMYDPTQDTPARARTSNMNADLGMIAHIFSDKTGTLTQNVMKFKRCACAGRVYGGEDAAPPDRLAALKQLVVAPPSKKTAERDLVEIMAVCHTVVVDENGFQAESPDEEALVAGAADLGLTFATRTPEAVEVTLDAPSGARGTALRYDVLATIPFDSTRKRMSVLVKGPDGEARVLTKGADSIVFGLAGADGFRRTPGGKAALDASLASFARDGLRTLVLARRDVSASDCSKFQKAWAAAEAATTDRAGRKAAAAATLEKDLEIVGATAIEDKLQEGVPATIAELARADIKIWVLTGDKMETAINVGYACRLLTPDMYLVKLPADGAAAPDYGVARQLEALENVVKSAAARAAPSAVAPTALADSTLPAPLVEEADAAAALPAASEHLALVIEGATALEAILGDAELEKRFLRLAATCRAVVACRVSPAQKRLIVKLVREKSPSPPITLAVGDGANDVGMIQEAQIGVGISGREGRQAVNNADFAIAQFRFLEPLLLKHGRRNYRRMSKVIIYSFFKNIVLTFALFYFQSDCAWSGTSFYETWVYSGYNFFLGLLPIGLGWFDVDTSDETVRKYPRLYAAGLHRMDLNVTNMAYATLEAICASLIIYYATRQVYWRPQGVWTQHGKVADIWVFGTAVFVGMVNAMHVRACLLVDTWNRVQVFFVALQATMLYTFVIFMAQAESPLESTGFLDYDYFGVAYFSYAQLIFWLVTLVLVPGAVAALQLVVVALHLELFPNVNDVGRELDYGHVDGEKLHHHRHRFFVPLRTRLNIHDLVNRVFFGAAYGPPVEVTRDSLRSVSETLGREQSTKLGLMDEPSTSYSFDAASQESFFAAGEEAEAKSDVASEVV